MPGEWLIQLWVILCCLFFVTVIVTGLFIWPCLVANERRQQRIFEENQAYWIEVRRSRNSSSWNKSRRSD